jgi:hypothetical protein
MGWNAADSQQHAGFVPAPGAAAPPLPAPRAGGLEGVQGDGQRLAFVAAFAAVFSNAALHGMPGQDAVARGVFRALGPGCRHVGECGGFPNIAAIRATARAEREREEEVIAEIGAVLAPVLADGSGRPIADDVRLRWQARKPGDF